jgi:uncharacterized protein with NAD-binding domain and iron-sulfur cluster
VGSQSLPLPFTKNCQPALRWRIPRQRFREACLARTATATGDPGSRPVEVAIIGGGCAAVTAAFELTRPEHRGKYHVTIYQVGWRLGGKGASGRGRADRIEEHGLHVWLGFYENAFRLLRECYAELAARPGTRRFATWQDAFMATPVVGVADRGASGAWQPWLAHFPAEPGLPGDPLEGPNPFSVGTYLVRTAILLRTLFVACRERQVDAGAPSVGGGGAATADAARAASPLDDVARLLRYGTLATLLGLIEAAWILEAVLAASPGYPQELVLRFLDVIATNAQRQLASLADRDDEVRRLWEVIDLVLAILRGLVRFGVAFDPRGFDAIDDYECREWLRLNGASPRSLDSAIMRGLYDLALAYEDGDAARPRLAAGQALRGSLRMFFTYRGSLFWKMRAGMGDVVFAPFYEVLKRRGVTFRFFHRLENVGLVAPERLKPGERPYVDSLEFDVQADVLGGDEYRPLVDVRGLPCWPARPDPAQLVDGERFAAEGREFESHWDRRCVRRKTLRVVDDFDFVVLAVGLGAVPHVCTELVACDPRWADMVRHGKTVATQAFQIWMRDDMRALGWPHPPTTVSGFVQPFDTWADMAHLIPEESWPVPPRALAYFCSVLPDDEPPANRSDMRYPARRREVVRQNAIRFLDRHVGHLWPKAVQGSSGFRWDLLVDAADAAGTGAGADAQRFDGQFWTANVNPSDRYTLCVPGSPRYRISPLDNTYDNLTIAGDWTACGFTEGCVEAAVMSGRLAAHALSQCPPLEDIVGYDHP